MGRRRHQITQEQHDAAMAAERRGAGRPKREGAPDMRQLGVGAAWLRRAHALFAAIGEGATPDVAECRAMARDTAELIAKAARSNEARRGAIRDAIASRAAKPRSPKWHYLHEVDSETGPSYTTHHGPVEAAKAWGTTPNSFAVQMSRHGGRLVRPIAGAKGLGLFETMHRVRPKESGTKLASEQNE